MSLTLRLEGCRVLTDLCVGGWLQRRLLLQLLQLRLQLLWRWLLLLQLLRRWLLLLRLLLRLLLALLQLLFLHEDQLLLVLLVLLSCEHWMGERRRTSHAHTQSRDRSPIDASTLPIKHGEGRQVFAPRPNTQQRS